MNAAYQRITNEIITRLEAGTVPWRRPWTRGPPRNLASGKPYRGTNALLLAAQTYEQPWWLTYRQAQRLGGHVQRGEHGVQVVYWQPATTHNQGNAQRSYPLLRTYTVFNLTQCNGIDPPRPTRQPDPGLEAIVAAMPHPPPIRHGGNRAAYDPGTDTVHMPFLNDFSSLAAYYAVLFHELVHSTGHQSRLNRPGITERTGPSNPVYAREELVAEIGAAFLCGHAGIAPATIDDIAAYIDGWLRILKQHPRIVIHAAGAAQHAAEYILAKQDERGAEDGAPGPAETPADEDPSNEYQHERR